MCLETCIIIPVKANEKGQYVSWLSNTTVVRQIMISGKLAFSFEGYVVTKFAQFKEKCSFLELFYLALNVVYCMLKISEWNDIEPREGEEDFHINLCRMCHFSGYHFST